MCVSLKAIRRQRETTRNTEKRIHHNTNFHVANSIFDLQTLKSTSLLCLLEYFYYHFFRIRKLKTIQHIYFVHLRRNDYVTLLYVYCFFNKKYHFFPSFDTQICLFSHLSTIKKKTLRYFFRLFSSIIFSIRLIYTWRMRERKKNTAYFVCCFLFVSDEFTCFFPRNFFAFLTLRFRLCIEIAVALYTIFPRGRIREIIYVLGSKFQWYRFV